MQAGPTLTLLATMSTSISSQQADALNGPVSVNRSLDILHFFADVERAQHSEDPPPKICKLCSYVRTFLYTFYFLIASSEKYGTDMSTLDGAPSFIFKPSFIFQPRTANTNLRRHLYQVHAEEYDKAVLNNKWGYKLSSGQSSG